MRFQIIWDDEALEWVGNLRAYYSRRIIADVDKFLTEDPATESGPKKYLDTFVPPWSTEPGVWQLSVGDYRVLYDVLMETRTVEIRLVFYKSPGSTTGDSV